MVLNLLFCYLLFQETLLLLTFFIYAEKKNKSRGKRTDSNFKRVNKIDKINKINEISKIKKLLLLFSSMYIEGLRTKKFYFNCIFTCVLLKTGDLHFNLIVYKIRCSVLPKN